MKNLIATLFLLPTLAFSQNNIETLKFDAHCVNAQVLNQFLKNYGEQPVFRATSNRDTRSGEVVGIVSVFYLNRQTMTWTIVERIDHDKFCIIGTGDTFEFISNDRQNRKSS
jgi:hypothetical protein